MKQTLKDFLEECPNAEEAIEFFINGCYSCPKFKRPLPKCLGHDLEALFKKYNVDKAKKEDLEQWLKIKRKNRKKK